MKSLLLVSVVLAVCFVVAPADAQQPRDWSKVEMKATRAAGAVHMLEGLGGNIGVSVGDDGILIVDDQFAPLADKIRAALKSLGEGKLKFVLNTHWHGDHTGGNVKFGPEAPIIAHTNVRKRMSTPQRSEVFKSTTPAAPKEALPVVTFDESLSVHFNGEEIRVIHFPRSHTDGDSVIFFTGSNVVHMGDNFFAGKFPFVDMESGGSVDGMTKSVGDIIARLPADVKIIPGHGPLSTLDDLKAYHRMLIETTDIVRKRMAAGRTLEQIKAEGLPEVWKDWGTGFIKTDVWIETIYRNFSPRTSQGKRPGARKQKAAWNSHGHRH
ncbi:MAG TPA: MBL fold metallo-hydrolase [Pyrinomonadaceae bacterium]|nr:MBL fold metallo-hydrolase [Pyrinomonadaceae bacterium]